MDDLADRWKTQVYRPTLPVLEIDGQGALHIRVPGYGGGFTLYPYEYTLKMVLGAAGFVEITVTDNRRYEWPISTIRVFNTTGEIVVS